MSSMLLSLKPNDFFPFSRNFFQAAVCQGGCYFFVNLSFQTREDQKIDKNVKHNGILIS